MVKRLILVIAFTGALNIRGQAFERLDGPAFFNTTAHNVQMRATFTNGDDFPVVLVPGAFGTYWDLQQVAAIDVNEGNGHEIHLSGTALPKVPDGLSKPYDQIWMIDDSQVCIVPRRHFDRDKHPKC
jgi:hypothetical protein